MVGTKLGHYKILRLVGEGGMGRVFEAVHETIERRAAIKVLHAQFAHNSEAYTRFLNEARAVNIVQHPGLVDVYEFGQTDEGSPYIVMEFLEGESLSHRLNKAGRLSVGAIRIARQIASALTAAHRKHIVHRDLKPSNVMLVPDPDMPGGERVKVVDFGIAKFSRQTAGAHQTRAGAILGTPAYMSPEQCRGAGEVTEKTDVYALGVIMFEMLAGRPPFIAEGEGEIMAMHLYKAPPALHLLEPTLPLDLVNLVHTMMSKDADQRPTIEEVGAELDRIGPQLSGSTTPVLVDFTASAPAPSPPPRQTMVLEENRPKTPPPGLTPHEGWHGAMTRPMIPAIEARLPTPFPSSSHTPTPYLTPPVAPSHYAAHPVTPFQYAAPPITPSHAGVAAPVTPSPVSAQTPPLPSGPVTLPPVSAQTPPLPSGPVTLSPVSAQTPPLARPPTPPAAELLSAVTPRSHRNEIPAPSASASDTQPATPVFEALEDDGPAPPSVPPASAASSAVESRPRPSSAMLVEPTPLPSPLPPAEPEFVAPAPPLVEAPHPVADQPRPPAVPESELRMPAAASPAVAEPAAPQPLPAPEATPIAASGLLRSGPNQRTLDSEAQSPLPASAPAVVAAVMDRPPPAPAPIPISRPVSTRSRKPTLIAVVAGGVLLVGIVLAVVLSRRAPQPPSKDSAPLAAPSAIVSAPATPPTVPPPVAPTPPSAPAVVSAVPDLAAPPPDLSEPAENGAPGADAGAPQPARVPLKKKPAKQRPKGLKNENVEYLD